MPDQAAEVRDADLIAATAQGDRDAFGALVDRYQQPVLYLARAIVRDPELAEDVLQETFLAAFRAAASYRGDAPVSAWLYGIARHIAYRLRRRAREIASDDRSLERLAQHAGWGSPDVERAVAHEQLRERVTTALLLLPDEEREILMLRDGLELSGAETAELLGVGLAAMKSRLHRARLALAGRLRALKGEIDDSR